MILLINTYTAYTVLTIYIFYIYIIHYECYFFNIQIDRHIDGKKTALPFE